MYAFSSRANCHRYQMRLMKANIVRDSGKMKALAGSWAAPFIITATFASFPPETIELVLFGGSTFISASAVIFPLPSLGLFHLFNVLVSAIEPLLSFFHSHTPPPPFSLTFSSSSLSPLARLRSGVISCSLICSFRGA